MLDQKFNDRKCLRSSLFVGVLGGTYALCSLVSQLILLGNLIAVLILWDILCDGMVGMRLLGVGFSTHCGGCSVVEVLRWCDVCIEVGASIDVSIREVGG
jgi:hypothetical protein